MVNIQTPSGNSFEEVELVQLYLKSDHFSYDLFQERASDRFWLLLPLGNIGVSLIDILSH